MTKTYRLNAIRPLMPMAREALPLLASFYPLGGEPTSWLIRYIVDSEGFWLQVNDEYGSNNSPLSFHEFEGMTCFTQDDLEHSQLEGQGYRWGLLGGKPILPLPFTAGQFLEFDNITGGAGRGSFPLSVEDLTKLEQVNPDAAELARIILSGVVPTTEVAPEQNSASPAPESDDPPESVDRIKRQTWRDVAWPYVVATFKAGQFATAKALFKALESKASTGDSPFDKGTGTNVGSLFVRDIDKPLAVKTIENAWADIRNSR